MGFVVVGVALLILMFIASIFTISGNYGSRLPGIISIIIIVVGFIYYWYNIREPREIIIDGTYIRIDMSNTQP